MTCKGKKKELAELVAGGMPPHVAAVNIGYTAEAADRILNKPELQEYVKNRRHEMVNAYAMNKDLIQLLVMEFAMRCMQGAPHMKKNQQTKEMEPDGIWNFEYNGAIRGLLALNDILGKEESYEGEQAAFVFDGWVVRQDTESGL